MNAYILRTRSQRGLNKLKRRNVSLQISNRIAAFPNDTRARCFARWVPYDTLLLLNKNVVHAAIALLRPSVAHRCADRTAARAAAGSGSALASRPPPSPGWPSQAPAPSPSGTLAECRCLGRTRRWRRRAGGQGTTNRLKPSAMAEEVVLFRGYEAPPRQSCGKYQHHDDTRNMMKCHQVPSTRTRSAMSERIGGHASAQGAVDWTRFSGAVTSLS